MSIMSIITLHAVTLDGLFLDLSPFERAGAGGGGGGFFSLVRGLFIAFLRHKSFQLMSGV